MKIFLTHQSRAEYLETQIRRSESKFGYCKVSVHDVKKYETLLRQYLARNGGQLTGPVLCLGTRNGREVDLFRTRWFGSPLLAAVTERLEDTSRSFRGRLSVLEAIGRSNVERLTPKSVVGVELNPQAARRDIHIGSFDDMPPAWGGVFGIAFSNAFDQSEDPLRTAAEWRRVIRPGGFLIFCYSNGAMPSVHDPIGCITLPDVQQLFGGRLVSFHDGGSRNGYSEVILQMP